MLFYNKTLKKYSRKLRKNSTEAEIFLWSKLRMNQLSGLRFYRQRIIGNYIVDSYCPRGKLVIEVDSGKMLESDAKRDEYFAGQGLKVLRFNDYDVMTNIEGVVEMIIEHFGSATNPP